MDRKYEILFIGDLPKEGNNSGAPVVNFEFLNRINNDERFSTLCVFPLFTDDKLLAYEFRNLPLPTKYFRSRSWGDILSKYDFAVKIKKFISQSKTKYDLIHIDTSNHLALIIKGASKVIFSHGSPKLNKNLKHILRHPYATFCEILEKQHYRRALFNNEVKFVFINSQNSKKLTVNDFKLNESISQKIKPITLGCNVERFALNTLDKTACQKEILEKAGLKFLPNTIFLLFVGGFASHKGQDELIISLQDILKIHQQTILILAGKDSGILQKCRKLVQDLNLSQNIIISVGPQDKELGKLFKATDIYASASEEGFGINLAEAMKSGLPLVAWDKGAVKELFTNNKEGILVSSRDEFVKKVIFLIQNPEIRKQMAEDAEKTARAKYSWDNFYKEVVNYYLEILEN